MIIAFQTTQWRLQRYRWVQEVNSKIIETFIVCVGGGGGGSVCMYKDKYTGKRYL